MIDLNKPRLTENNKYTGEADCATPCCDIHKDCALGKNAEKGGCFYELVSRLNELENAIESGELVPVVRGKWEVDECDSFDDVPGYSWIDFHCSKCNMDYGLEEGEYSWCRGEKIPYHFCPNCGAKMVGG